MVTVSLNGLALDAPRYIARLSLGQPNLTAGYREHLAATGSPSTYLGEWHEPVEHTLEVVVTGDAHRTAAQALDDLSEGLRPGGVLAVTTASDGTRWTLIRGVRTATEIEPGALTLTAVLECDPYWHGEVRTATAQGSDLPFFTGLPTPLGDAPALTRIVTSFDGGTSFTVKSYTMGLLCTDTDALTPGTYTGDLQGTSIAGALNGQAASGSRTLANVFTNLGGKLTTHASHALGPSVLVLARLRFTQPGYAQARVEAIDDMGLSTTSATSDAVGITTTDSWQVPALGPVPLTLGIQGARQLRDGAESVAVETTAATTALASPGTAWRGIAFSAANVWATALLVHCAAASARTVPVRLVEVASGAITGVLATGALHVTTTAGLRSVVLPRAVRLNGTYAVLIGDATGVTLYGATSGSAHATAAAPTIGTPVTNASGTPRLRVMTRGAQIGHREFYVDTATASSSATHYLDTWALVPCGWGAITASRGTGGASFGRLEGVAIEAMHPDRSRWGIFFAYYEPVAQTIAIGERLDRHAVIYGSPPLLRPGMANTLVVAGQSVETAAPTGTGHVRVSYIERFLEPWR